MKYKCCLLLMIFLSANLFAFSDNIDVNINSDQNTSIFYRVRYDNENSILQYVKSHLFVLDKYDINRRNLLHYAVLYKKYRLLRFLIDQKKNIAIQDGAGNTPLHLAVMNRDTYAIKLLMLSPSFAIALKLKNGDNLTPLEIAAKRNDKNVVDLLRSFGTENNQEWIDYDNFNEDFEKQKQKHKKFFEKLREKTKKKHNSHIESSHIIKGSKNTGNIDIHLGERK
ncbi:ankyrin repeat domain-containing protein [Nitratiruptor tergarcus]|nr:ankyrin repeat domain-containing protein [Nitratiruptor tergarcus]